MTEGEVMLWESYPLQSWHATSSATWLCICTHVFLKGSDMDVGSTAELSDGRPGGETSKAEGYAGTS